MIFGAFTNIAFAIIVLLSIVLTIVNGWRADKNMDKAAKYQQALHAFNRGDMEEGKRIKAQADAMPLYGEWPKKPQSWKWGKMRGEQ